MGVQSLVLIGDAVLCNLESSFHLARVTFEVGKTVCRPHAWYFEPSFFVVYAVFFLFVLRVMINRAWDEAWQGIYKGVFVLSVFAILFSTSRMGWLALASVAFAELVYLLLQGKGGPLLGYLSQNPKGRTLRWGSPVLVFILFWAAFQLPIVRQTYESIEQIAQLKDSSLKTRWYNLASMLRAFRDHPLVGVGPGTVGAYVFKHYPDDPSFHFLWSYTDGFKRQWKMNWEERAALIPNVSFSNSAYGELLAEWGLLGTLAFCVALLTMFRRGPPIVWIYWLTVAPVVLVTWQTLQRFDIWLILSILILLCRRHEEEQKAVKSFSS